MRLLFWILIAVCAALMLRRAFAHAVRAGIQRTLRARSWGTDWAGGCFEVVQTNRAGCDASYANDARVTLRVR